MIKPIYNYLCETMVKGRLFITSISSFLVLVKHKIATSDYYHIHTRVEAESLQSRKYFCCI